MNRIKYCLLTLVLIFSTTTSAISQNQVRWLSIEKAVESQKNEPKKILVFIYTDWCKICKKMDKNTYSDNDIAKYINENFYPVRFNAESTKDVSFNDINYKSEVISGNRYHGLALELSDGNLMYPTQVFLDEDQNVIQSIIGYLNKDEMIKIGIYYGDNIYKETSWNSYARSMNNKYDLVQNANFNE